MTNDEQQLTPEATPCPDCDRMKQECATYKDGWQRAVADYQNLQKETVRQRTEWVTLSEWQIVSEFIPVYDNLKKAFAGDGKKDDNWAKGISYIMKQFGDVLKAHGIEEIKTVGELFDATKHEAVGEESAEVPEHTIIREVEGGYMVKGKVVKVAKVVIVKS